MTTHTRHILAAICLLLCGCGSAYRATSKPVIGYSSFSPTILVNPPASTNIAQQVRSRTGSFDAQADIRAPVIICAEQLYLSFWGGTAASNSVLSEIQIPIPGAP